MSKCLEIEPRIMKEKKEKEIQRITKFYNQERTKAIESISIYCLAYLIHYNCSEFKNRSISQSFQPEKPKGACSNILQWEW